MIRRNFLKSVLALAAAPLAMLKKAEPERFIGVDLSSGSSFTAAHVVEDPFRGRRNVTNYYFVEESDLLEQPEFPFVHRVSEDDIVRMMQEVYREQLRQNTIA